MTPGEVIAHAADKKWGNARYQDFDVIVADADDWAKLIDDYLAKGLDRIKHSPKRNDAPPPLPISSRFRKLPKKQLEAFEMIAIGWRFGHHPATLKALEQKGLIEYEEKILGRDRLGPIIVKAPFVPIPIHIEWCEWCAEHYAE